MKIEKTRWLLGLLGVCLLIVSASAQTPTPPYIQITKQFNSIGEICPGGYIDVTITLEGAGSTAFLRYPINAVAIIDKSGSMASSGSVEWNEYHEPPYATIGTYGWPGRRNNPYVAACWAAWKFYQYFIDNPPSLGYDDYGGLIFYSYYYRIPGNYPVLTPTPIQRVRDNPLSPDHKNFWWHDRLVNEYPPGGNTAIGPAMQFSRDIFAAMPQHVPWYGPSQPTPSTPKPTVDGENFMVLLTDGIPNQYWTPGPSEVPSWSNNATNHAIEMARRMSLSAPYDVYTDVEDVTIFTIGLGSEVSTALLAILADPWNYAYWPVTTPTPSQANHGFFSWALTEADLVDVFETIAGNIVSNLAGSDIYVYEMVPALDSSCPGGDTVLTEIDESSFSVPPTVIPPATPGGNPAYTWDFSQLMIGDIIDVSFRMNIPTAAPTGVYSLIECPESEVTYLNYEGVAQEMPIIDPGFWMGDCDGPTVTPTPSATPTHTPTCVQAMLFSDDFEAGNYDLWDSADPSWGIRVHEDSELAHSGDYFSFMAGSESDFEAHEAYMLKVLDFSDPIRAGALLEFYVRLKGFSFPQKLGGTKDDPNPYDMFLVEVSDLYGHFWFQEYTYFDVLDDYFHVRVPLESFAGSDAVRIRLITNFPVTMPDPDPNGGEPMVFVDDVSVYDFCYEPTPTPTATPTMPPPIPTTSHHGIGFLLLIIGAIIMIPMFRRVV